MPKRKKCLCGHLKCSHRQSSKVNSKSFIERIRKDCLLNACSCKEFEEPKADVLKT